ncbi:MAG: phage tail protein [Alphaproteobacteria bacterium]
MAQPFVGQIELFPFGFAPVGWAACQGQLLPLSQYAALFSLLGTYYGGDGRSNFALPNLQGRVTVAYGQGPGLSNYVIGETAGAATVTLNGNQMPAHNHSLNVNANTGNTAVPTNALLATGPSTGSGTFKVSRALYTATNTPNTALSNAAISLTGGNGAHNNMQPYLVLGYYIALQGVFPPRS